MKVLYIAPENVTGGFDLFIAGHRLRGNEARYVLFFRTQFEFGEDICFDLKWMPTLNHIRWLKAISQRWRNGNETVESKGNPPFWQPAGRLEAAFFKIRDALNARQIRRVIDKYGLNNFDIYHFEQGVDPFRDGRWIVELAGCGKGIVCFYHGSDLRNRGVIEAVHKWSRLNLTSEIDLLRRLSGMKYLYLPIDTEAVKPQPRTPDGRIRIGHSARNRRLKGSDFIENLVKRLSERYPLDWVMIENVTHREARRMKAGCDIFIDQITDLGGWGYGASSVESLAMGIPTITRINAEVAAFLGEHPFIAADPTTLESRLVELIEEPQLREAIGEQARRWVEARHSLPAVMDCLYEYYREAGLI
ncbi:MAG: glycosyltransferase family 4 protein [Calditrichaeota bacterium]|nr:glycosyltransferase family 4 protein [Calditrichota bacterium]